MQFYVNQLNNSATTKKRNNHEDWLLMVQFSRKKDETPRHKSWCNNRHAWYTVFRLTVSFALLSPAQTLFKCCEPEVTTNKETSEKTLTKPATKAKAALVLFNHLENQSRCTCSGFAILPSTLSCAKHARYRLKFLVGENLYSPDTEWFSEVSSTWRPPCHRHTFCSCTCYSENQLY